MNDPTTLGLPQDSEAPEAQARPDAATHENGRNLRRSMRRNRSNLAAVTQELERHAAQEAAGWSKAEVASHLILFLYTLARIVANLHFGRKGQDWWWYWMDSSQRDLLLTWYALDGILRPLISGFGVYCFIRRNTRFSSKSRLHIWGRRSMFCIASCLADDSIGLNVGSVVMISLFWGWYILTNVLQIQMTNLKLKALGFPSLSRICEVLTVICVACVVGMVSLYAGRNMTDQELIIGNLACLGLVPLLQCLCLIFVTSLALYRAKGEEGIWCAVSCLYVNASLVVLGPAVSIWSGVSWVWSRLAHSRFYPDLVAWGWLIQILDVGLQTLFVLLMCGMIGPKGWDKPMEAFRKLADLSGFGLAAQRIAFPGKIILSALDCIVSFPGKYSKEWDAAVSSTQQANGCSLACVFLTDRISGLGCHAENPDTPGRCWCHTIYGELPASAYLSVIDVHDDTNGPITEEVLAFKRADAAAMGLVLVVKEDQTELQWQSELSQALKAAEELCQQNGCRAPWGCSWFEEWRKNLEEAVRLGQILHVFYFEGKVGRGKLAWPKLCDSMAKEQARRDSGLGASQTAEVAYLEKMGLEYEEHDITEFEAFLQKPQHCSSELQV